MMWVTVLACSAAPAGIAVDNDERLQGDGGAMLVFSVEREPVAAIILRVVLENRTGETVVVDAASTPFEEPLSADVFDIRRGDESVAYLGRVLKRQAGRSSDAISLAPGERRVALIDLGAHYALARGEHHTVSPRRIERGGMTWIAGLPDVQWSPAEDLSFVP